VHEPALDGEREQLPRLGRGQRERLLADDVLAGRERRLHLRVVQVIGRRQVHDIDALVCEQCVVALVDGREPLRPGSVRARADDAGNLDPEPAQCIDVDGADEAGAHDTGPQLVDPARHSAAVALA
jgi:hypothetical protein